ncbi:hypothetical protein ACHAWX_007473 [Stephanocyclus meneghinianus]
MSDADADPQRPTGTAWPPSLRQALSLPESAVCARKDEDDSATITTMSNTSSQSDTTFTTSQLRQYIHRCYAAISSLQRQLHRGEESYFEESYAHGNLFSGWDNIWIEAGVPAASSGENNSGSSAVADGHAVSVGAQKSAPSRKMPNDHRWFSSSCHIAPRGDAKVAAILARESLLEPPLSSGGGLNEMPPANVSQVSVKLDSSAVKRSVSTKSEPANKKVKLDGGVMFEPTSVAAFERPSYKQQNDQSKPSTSPAPLSSTNLELSGSIQSAESNSSINLTQEPTHIPMQEVMPSFTVSSSAFAADSQQTKVALSSSTEIDAGAEIKSTNQSTATPTGEVIDSTCDMEVDGIVDSSVTVVPSAEVSSTTKSAAPSLSPSTVIASSTSVQANASSDTINTAKREAPTHHLKSSDLETSPEKNTSSTYALKSMEAVQGPSAASSSEPSVKALHHETSIAATIPPTPSSQIVDEFKGGIFSPDNNSSLSEQQKLECTVSPAMGSKEEARLSDTAASVDLEENANSNPQVDESHNALSVEKSSQSCNLQQDPSQQSEAIESSALSDKPDVEDKNQSISSEQAEKSQSVAESPTSSETGGNEDNPCTNKKRKRPTSTSPFTPETTTEPKARKSDTKNAADSSADRDSDEDQTLSEIVQLKAKSPSKEAVSPAKDSTSEIKSHAGKRTSSRRRRSYH